MPYTSTTTKSGQSNQGTVRPKTVVLARGLAMKKLLFIASAALFCSLTMAFAQPEETILDEDYRINVVMKHLGLTEGPTHPEQRARWLEIYTYITRPVGVAHLGRSSNAPPPESPREEGYLGTRVTRLQNPNDKEQKRVADILVTQPVPKERTEHYEAVLKQCFLAGWGLQISSATTTDDVTTVTAMWLPRVRRENYRGRPAWVNNPLVETWEVKGDVAKLVKTTSPGDAYVAGL